MEKFTILLLGHGSSLPYNKKLVEETANMLRKKNKITVHVAFLNKDTPVIKEALKKLSNTGVNRIVALPLFLAHGVHTLEDIPAQLGIENGARKTTIKNGDSHVEIFYAEPLGADPIIAEIAYQRAMEAIEVVK
jgi:sirohydrochlorin cobaltochelatase